MSSLVITTASPIMIMNIAGKQHCDIDASVSMFGDPCPGSYKYLRLKYTCAGEFTPVNIYNTYILLRSVNY